MLRKRSAERNPYEYVSVGRIRDELQVRNP